MTAPGAPFQKLKGIGPAKASKLHDCGVRSWDQLAEVLDVAARINGVDARRLRDLRNEARRRALDEAEAAADEASEVAEDALLAGDLGLDRDAVGERIHPFLVRISMLPDGLPSRSRVTDVRSGETDSFPGMSAADIGGFIQRQLQHEGEHGSKAADSPTTEPASVPGSAPAPAPAPAPPPADTAAGGASVPPAASGQPFVVAAGEQVGGSSRAGDSVVTVDAGGYVGGTERAIVVPFDLTGVDLGGRDSFGYRALLFARPYGTTDASSFGIVAVTRGTALTGDHLDVTFEAVGLKRALYRLQATVEL